MPLYLADTTKTRTAIIDACRWLNSSGLNQGTSGNISVRVEDGVLLTPSGIPYDDMRPEMLQLIPHDGSPEITGPLRPTTEWHFHQSILAARSDIAAVVHGHPAYATAISMQRRSIPACHYMVAAFGGNDVPLVDYATFGTERLSKLVAEALSERTGCLMANHGAITCGETLEKALWRFEELEHLARVFLLSQTNGEPVLLTDDEMQKVLGAFVSYGPKTGEL